MPEQKRHLPDEENGHHLRGTMPQEKAGLIRNFVVYNFGERHMSSKRDITTLEDIKLMVDTFYGRVQEDELIGGIFAGVIRNWPQHLDTMYRFWQTILLGEHTYSGRPFLPHAQLPLEWLHFERWLQLFGETVDRYFEGRNAEEAKRRATLMAEIFHHKIQYYRDRGIGKPLA